MISFFVLKGISRGNVLIVMYHLNIIFLVQMHVKSMLLSYLVNCVRGLLLVPLNV